jgi:hypothetical protein
VPFAKVRSRTASAHRPGAASAVVNDAEPDAGRSNASCDCADASADGSGIRSLASRGEKTNDFSYSVGISVSDKESRIDQVAWNGPAFKPGLAGGSKLVAVNMQEYKPERLAAAITANKDGSHPIELLVKEGELYRLARWPALPGARTHRGPAVPVVGRSRAALKGSALPGARRAPSRLRRSGQWLGPEAQGDQLRPQPASDEDGAPIGRELAQPVEGSTVRERDLRSVGPGHPDSVAQPA